MHWKGSWHHEGQGSGEMGKDPADAARIRRPSPADFEGVMGGIRGTELVAQAKLGHGDDELRQGWPRAEVAAAGTGGGEARAPDTLQS